MELLIKTMETEDEIRGKAYVHWKSWQESYAGLVDAAYLQRLTLARCEEMARRYPDNILVAIADGRVVGFAAAGACRDEDGRQTEAGEVYAIYVLEAYQHRGIGLALMRRALALLSGCRSASVWVLKENKKAIRFYERVGFRVDGKEKVLTLGTPVTVQCMSLALGKE